MHLILYIVSGCSSVNDAKVDHCVQVVTVGSFHCELTVFPLSSSRSGMILRRRVNIQLCVSFSHNVLSLLMILALIIYLGFQNYDFLKNDKNFLHLNWHSSIIKGFSSSTGAVWLPWNIYPEVISFGNLFYSTLKI